jgi:hypothetical protein
MNCHIFINLDCFSIILITLVDHSFFYFLFFIFYFLFFIFYFFDFCAPAQAVKLPDAIRPPATRYLAESLLFIGDHAGALKYFTESLEAKKKGTQENDQQEEEEDEDEVGDSDAFVLTGKQRYIYSLLSRLSFSLPPPPFFLIFSTLFFTCSVLRGPGRPALSS